MMTYTKVIVIEKEFAEVDDDILYSYFNGAFTVADKYGRVESLHINPHSIVDIIINEGNRLSHIKCMGQCIRG